MIINAEIIKEFRKNNNLTQEMLAELLGVSWRTIQNYEAGGKIPKSKSALFHKTFKLFNEEKVVNENTEELTEEENRIIRNVVLNKTKALLEHETFSLWLSLKKDKIELDLIKNLEKQGKLKR